MDPLLKKQSEFGVPGNTVKIGRETYVGCVVIGAPPHTSCPMYTQTMAMSEKQYRKRLIENGEFGTRDNTIQRLGFLFQDVKKEKVKKLVVNEDRELSSAGQQEHQARRKRKRTGNRGKKGKS